MIAVVMEAFQDLADKPIVIVSIDQIFDAVENDLLSQEYLGASGIRSISESDERVPRDACRVLTRTEKFSGCCSGSRGFQAFPDRAEIKHERRDRFSTCAVMRSPGLPKFGERLCVASLKRDHLRGFEKKPALAPFDSIADFFEPSLFIRRQPTRSRRQ